MEPNDHAQGEKWSERQIGVYHRFSLAPNTKDIMILLHPMLESKAQKRLDNMFSEGKYNGTSITNPLRLHLLIFSIYMDNWRWYMDELGLACLRLVRKIVRSEMKERPKSWNRRIKASQQRLTASPIVA